MAAAARDDKPTLSPLTSVQVVLRSSPTSRVAALSHVVTAISDFLDYAFPHFWSLPRACEANLLSLLSRLAACGISTDTSMPYFYWLYQCRQGLVFAVKHDNFAMVEWLHGYCRQALPYHTMMETAASGNLRLLQWLAERHASTQWMPLALDAAASTGRLEMIQWVLNRPKSDGWFKSAMLSATRSGHLDAVQ